MRRILFFLLILLVPALSHSADRYVDCNRASNGTGTASNPYNTMASLSSYSSGDVIKFKGGSTCRGSIPTPTVNNVTFTNYSTTTTKPTITGTKLLTGWAQVGSTSIYQVTQGQGEIWVNGVRAKTVSNQNMSGVNPELEYNSTTGIGLVQGEYYCTGGKIYLRSNGGNPDSIGWVVETRNTANIFSLSDTANNVSDITLNGLRLIRSSDYAVSIADPASTNITLTNMEIDEAVSYVLFGGLVQTLSNSVLSNGYKYNTAYGVNLNNASATVTISGVLFNNFQRQSGIQVSAAGTYTVNSCTFAAVANYAIYNLSATAVGTVKNSIFAGVPLSALYPPLYNNTTWTTGSLTASYNLFSGGTTTGALIADSQSWWTTVAGKAITDGGNNRGGNPTFKQMQPLYVIYSSDEWEVDTEYSGYHLAMLNLIKSYNKPRWDSMSMAVHWTTGYWNTSGTLIRGAYTATDWSNMQLFHNAGGEIAAHTRYHLDISEDRVGTITTTYNDVTIEITATRFKVLRSGVLDTTNLPAQSPDGFDISAGGTYQYTKDLLDYINGKTGYTTTKQTALYGVWKSIWLARGAPAYTLTATVATTLVLDIPAYYADNVTGNVSDLESNITGLDVKTILIPNGPYNTHFYSAPYIQATGLIGARTIDQPSLNELRMNTPWKIDSYEITATTETSSWVTSGMVAFYTMYPTNSNYLTDTTLEGSNGLSESGSIGSGSAVTAARATGAYYYSMSGAGYLYRASLVNMKYTNVGSSVGDWQWGAYIYPTTISGGNRTLLWQSGADPTQDYHWLYIDTNGQLHYVLVVGGVTRIDINSGATLLSINTPYAVSVRQVNGRLSLLLGTNKKWADVEVAYSTAAYSPANCTSRFQIFASYLSSSAGNYYIGYADNIYVAARPWHNVTGRVLLAQIMGSALHYYFHDRLPHDLVKTQLDYINTYVPYARVTSFKNYLTETQALGTISPSGLTYSYSTGITNSYYPAKGGSADVSGDGVSYLGAYSPAYLSITPSAGANGSISPASTQNATLGDTTQFTITPSSGYAISSVGGTCGGVLVGNTFTITAATQDCTVVASFVSTGSGASSRSPAFRMGFGFTY